MPTEADKLSIAKASIQESTKGDEDLACLLSRIPEALFGPEPGRVSIESWALIEEKAKQDDAGRDQAQS